MVPALTLWLPVLLSAVFVFIASSLIHMLLKYHTRDYRQLPAEERRGTGLGRRLMEAIEDLGRRHVGYGVKDEHYDTVGQALLWTLATGLGDAFTPETEQAWTEAYTLLATVMKQAAATEVSRGAEEISQGNANLSQRTEEQASSLEQTASSMEEMTSTVKQNADNSGQANQLAVAARDQAEKGGKVVAKAVDAMTEINESSKKIADIIGVIDEIAFQTNLLALNAAVEAARAGEQGRGFAVVASEVRNLAGRSATAAKEIKDLIQDSVKKVEEGSDLVTESGTTLEQIVTAVKKVSDIIAEIAAASQEQSSGIEQVNKAVAEMEQDKFIVATDDGIFWKMQQVAPHKTLISAPTAGEGATCESCAHCPWMAMNSLQNLEEVLLRGHNEIHIDEEIRRKALIPIERMLKFAEEHGISGKYSGD